VKPAALLAGHRPLATEAVTVAHPGAAPLFVFAMRSGFCHWRNLSMKMAFLLLHLGV
jgi:hypothetical protein